MDGDGRKKDNICLCVGAGITQKIVGSWDSLLNDTAKQIMNSKWKESKGNLGSDILDLKNIEIFDKGAVLEKGEYILGIFWNGHREYSTERMAMLAEVSFSEVVRRIIQNNIEGYLDDAARVSNTLPKVILDIWSGADSTAASDLATLAAVIRICLSGKISQIIDYNFDTILEQCLSDRAVQEAAAKLNGESGIVSKIEIHVWTYGKVREKRSINGITYHFGELPVCFDETGSNPDIRKINIYHVHGICSHQIEPMPIVFSEHSYKDFVRLTGNWSSQILMSVMQRYDIKTVGFSGTDTNFRHIVRELKSANDSEFYGSGNSHDILLTASRESYVDKLSKSFKRRKATLGAPLEKVLLKGEEQDVVKFIGDEYFRMMAKYYEMNYSIRLETYENYDEIAKSLIGMI